MRCALVVVLVVLVVLVPGLTAGQASKCESATECQQLADVAASRGDYEEFHTLAWRAVQTGPANDPARMFVLARAQSLSGRPHDALVMLRRLVERGNAPLEAETSDDFRRVRALPGWAELLDRIHAAAGKTTPKPTEPAAATEASSPAPPPSPGKAVSGTPALVAPTPPATVVAPPPPAADADAIAGLAVPAAVSSAVAMAHDATSGRYVLADDRSGTLKVLDETSGRAVDLVGRGWAAPYRTSAIAIDPRRGDLWVAGSHAEEGVARSAVHRLQLISGRRLYAVELPASEGAARFTDLAVEGGAVLLLDAEGRRLFELPAGSKTLRLRARVPDLVDPASVAPSANGPIYVSHAGGVVRIGPGDDRVHPVAAANGMSLDGLVWIRAYRGGLVAVQRSGDDALVAVRIRLDSRGRTAIAREVLGRAASRAALLSGNVFAYVAASPDGSLTVKRVALGK